MLELYQRALRSRLFLGSARYPSPAVLAEAVRAARAEVVTVSLRRESSGERAGQGFWALIRDLGVQVLPNTAGCHSVKEAVTTAHMAREVFATPWIKLEVIGEDDTLQPDVFGLTEAARILCAEGFQVFPYTTEDLVVAERLLQAGCRVLMPWGAPIGSGRGLNNLFGLKALRAHFPEVPLIIDAGIGGETAHAVGRLLQRLAERAQVVTITHLPQIAALADRHFRVEKTPGDPTHTRIEQLDDAERKAELERMLGGEEFLASISTEQRS